MDGYILSASASLSGTIDLPNAEESEIIALSNAILAGLRKSRRLSRLEDRLAVTGASEHRKHEVRERQSEISSAGWDMRARLARLQAVTEAEKQAKARVMREFTNAFDCCSAYDDDALALSLANDVLGRPSRFKAQSRERATEYVAPAPSLREQFPLLKALPASVDAFLAQAEADFPILQQVEALQHESDATLAQRQAEQPDVQSALYLQLTAVDARYEQLRLALRGELIRLGMNIYRETGALPELQSELEPQTA